MTMRWFSLSSPTARSATRVAALSLPLLLLIQAATAFYNKSLVIEAAASAGVSYPDDAANSIYSDTPAPRGLRPLEVKRIPAKKTTKFNSGHYVIHFERAAFGAFLLSVRPSAVRYSIEVRLGERLTKDGRVWLPTPGVDHYPTHIAHFSTKKTIEAGVSTIVIEGPPRFRPHRSLLPNGLTTVFPFRYVEIVGIGGSFVPEDSAQLMVHYPFDNDASSFVSSSPVLTDVWDLAKHTIDATTYARLFVDGNRERKPYEADAYINQLGHYSTTNDHLLSRHTLDYLLRNPTWPTEWVMNAVSIAYEDYMRTGDAEYLRSIYSRLRPRLLDQLGREDGLISTRVRNPMDDKLSRVGIDKLEDIVDWPPSERDSFHRDKVDWPSFVRASVSYYLRLCRAYAARVLGLHVSADVYSGDAIQVGESRFVLPKINSVVNLVHLNCLVRMEVLANAIGMGADADYFRNRATLVSQSVRSTFIDENTQLFIDGEGSRHSSLHANMYALAFEVVPEKLLPRVAGFVARKGMACSVFGAQFLLEGLYRSRNGNHALKLLTAQDERSWWGMKHLTGSSMTTESWNGLIKPNTDWNHAWGTVPLNIISRWLVGVRPVTPGYGAIVIDPQPGNLQFFRATVPTGRSSVGVHFANHRDSNVEMRFALPKLQTAHVFLPVPSIHAFEIAISDGRKFVAHGTTRVHLGTFVGGSYHVVAKKLP